ncbi:MAG: hypothetical protein ABW169_00435, partial [Sphingobium sp.]
MSDPTFPVLCVYADEDGISHLIDLALPGMSRKVRADGTSEFGGVMGATVFGVVTPMHNGPKFIDWHISRMAGLSIGMTGEWEIEAGSGQRRILGPGPCLLMLDTSGQGHRAHYRTPGCGIGVGIAPETEAAYRAILAGALA